MLEKRARTSVPLRPAIPEKDVRFPTRAEEVCGFSQGLDLGLCGHPVSGQELTGDTYMLQKDSGPRICEELGTGMMGISVGLMVPVSKGLSIPYTTAGQLTRTIMHNYVICALPRSWPWGKWSLKYSLSSAPWAVHSTEGHHPEEDMPFSSRHKAATWPGSGLAMY